MMTTRTLTTMLVVALLAMAAGCGGTGGGTNSPTNATDTPGASVTDSPAATDSPTASPTPTPGTDGGNGTATDAGTDENGSDGTDASAGATGQMAVVIDGERVDLSEAVDSERFRMDAEAPDTYHANASLTVAEALSAAGVDASADSLSYNGETYRASANGTKVVYRVNGESVDPTDAELGDGDEVWVLVYTDDSDYSTPGTHISPDRLHAHGSMTFTVNGDELNFSRDKWQDAGHNDHFHFEGGEAEPWHAHSWSVTLAYALSTLEDIEANETGITYNGTTYAYDDPSATVSVTVNGEAVNPTTYYLKDGDDVRIEIEGGSEN